MDRHRDATPPDAWQKLLTDRPPEAGRDQPGTLGFFLELTRTDASPAARLEAAPVLLAPKAQGPLARATPLDAHGLAQASLVPAEQRLAATVLGQPLHVRKKRHYAQLSGTLGDALLTEMLDTAPCFLGGIAGLHLARGKSRTLTWHWQLQEDGQQRLLPLLPHRLRLLLAGNLWYLDAERAELGILHSDHDETRFLDTPPLAPEHSAALAAALADSPLAQRLPPPHVFKPARRVDIEPRPVLILHALARHARLPENASPLAYARLAFDYGEQRLSGRDDDPRVLRVQRGNLVEIQRQRARELAAMERLEACSLHPAVDTEGLPWDVADVLPEDAWLFSGKGHSGALDINTPAHWLALRERLERDGFLLDYAPSFPFEVPEGPVHWYASASETRNRRRFELEVGIELDARRINLLPAITHALHEGQLHLDPAAHEADNAVWYAPVDERRRVPLRVAELRPLLAPLAEYLERPAEHIRLPRVQAGRLDELARVLPDPDSLKAPPALRQFTARLCQAAKATGPAVPTALKAKLRPYQREGLRWLNALEEAGTGGILADDMGLGKTLQVLAHLLWLAQAGRLEHPVLVVAPTSLIPNWESEAARFAPSLSVLTLSGPARADRFDSIDHHAIVLTSYALLPRDIGRLKKHAFALAVLDEAQQVKNPRTHARRALLAIKAPRRLCLTGTPLENHLGELWSQMDLAVPGLLGDETRFRHHYRIPIEKQHDETAQERLNQRLAPFILRRTKAQVATELPPKTEVTRRVFMGARQRRLYEDLRVGLAEELGEAIRQRGIEHSGIIVLDALLKLRQVCCDPRLVKRESARGVSESAKFELLMEILPSLLAEGRRVLVFSQFTEMLKLIAAELKRRHLDFVTLTGETRDRAEPVRRFQDGEVPLFLLSLKAGGVGLNLTAADAVIHYDPWWNPAAEAQASDRAHRIGQDKPVLIYRLITADSVEERIEAMKARKAELAEAVLSGGGTRERLRFDQDDLDALLAPA